MGKYHVINMHFMDLCNYKCVYCYAHNSFKGTKSLEEWKKLIDDIDEYFKREKIKEGRINLVGGEPLLYNRLVEMIEYIHSKGITVSILTNGYYLTKDFVDKIADKVSMIGISIDSTNHETNIKIGRTENGKTLSIEQIEKISKIIKNYGIIFKINVVVSRLNIEEDFSELFERCSPDRIKMLQIYIINSVNKQSENLKVTREEFQEFVNKYSRYNPVVESNKDLDLGYLMVDSQGNLLINNQNEYIKIGDVFEEKISTLIEKMPYNLKNFNLRHKSVENGLVFGRFQLLHKGHEKMILQASKYAKHLIVGITNSNPYLKLEEDSYDRLQKKDNPFNYYERVEMVKKVLHRHKITNYTIVPFPIENLEKADYYLPKDVEIFINVYDEWGKEKVRRLEEKGYKVKVMDSGDNSKKYQSAKVLREMVREQDNSWKEFVSEEIIQLLEEENYKERILNYE